MYNIISLSLIFNLIFFYKLLYLYTIYIPIYNGAYIPGDSCNVWDTHYSKSINVFENIFF